MSKKTTRPIQKPVYVDPFFFGVVPRIEAILECERERAPRQHRYQSARLHQQVPLLSLDGDVWRAKHSKTAAVELLYVCRLCGAIRRWGLIQTNHAPLKVKFADLVVSKLGR